MSDRYLDAEILLGKTITSIAIVPADRLEIETSDGKRYAFLHNPDCCETCTIEQVHGDLHAVVGSPLIRATKLIPKEWDDGWPGDTPKPDSMPESFTWTFVTLETAAARVQIRWLGQSNGHYGEGVDLEEL